MKLRNRFLLVGSGIIIFLIATPLLVLYARGFKIDWQTGKLTKTGAIVINTQPTKAEIFLNDIKLEDTTPANVRFVLPADYNVRVQKDGYQSWTKRLSVKSQLVTWANSDRDFLALFLSEPKLEKNIMVSQSSLSDNGNEAAYIKNGQLTSIEVKNGEETDIGSFPNDKLPLLPTTATMAWTNANEIYNFLNNTEKIIIPAAQITKIQKVESDGSHIALIIENNLYVLNAGNLLLVDKTVRDFDLNGNDIWYLQGNLIRQYSFSTNKPTSVSDLNIPNAQESKIIRAENQFYLILDKNLHVVNDTLEKIYGPVTFAKFDPASKLMLYGNSNEIYIYNPNTKNSDLILRSLTPIKNPIINLATGYVLFTNEGHVKAVEMDARDHRNIFTLAPLTDPTGQFLVSEDGKKLLTVSLGQINYYTIR